MIRFVNAKINLGLNIVGKREDGYHELNTIFYPIGLYSGSVANPQPFSDILEIHLLDFGREDEFSFSGNSIDCPLEKNLVFKAAKAFRAAFPPSNNIGFKISLDKHIPDGAGLGGGSADATFILTSLNSLFGNPLNKNELIGIAASLGADCPFFIENKPVIASGIGEVMRPCAVDLSGYWLVLVTPEIYISTREAFANVTPCEPSEPMSKIVSNPIGSWEEKGLKNDFENSVFKQFPLLDIIKTRIKNAGALFASMSGSGSSIFGIFQSFEKAQQAAYIFPDTSSLILL